MMPMLISRELINEVCRFILPLNAGEWYQVYRRGDGFDGSKMSPLRIAALAFMIKEQVLRARVYVLGGGRHRLSARFTVTGEYGEVLRSAAIAEGIDFDTDNDDDKPIFETPSSVALTDFGVRLQADARSEGTEAVSFLLHRRQNIDTTTCFGDAKFDPDPFDDARYYKPRGATMLQHPASGPCYATDSEGRATLEADSATGSATRARTDESKPPQLNDKDREVAEYVRENPGKTLAQVAEAVGLEVSSLKSHNWKKLRKYYGFYAAPEGGCHPPDDAQ